MAKRIVAWVVGLALTALYASAVVAAVGNFILLPDMARTSMDIGMSGIGWFWLTFGIAMPVVVFALALLFGRKRTAVQRLLVLAAGVGVVAAVQLEVSLIDTTTFFAS